MSFSPPPDSPIPAALFRFAPDAVVGQPAALDVAILVEFSLGLVFNLCALCRIGVFLARIAKLWPLNNDGISRLMVVLLIEWPVCAILSVPYLCYGIFIWFLKGCVSQK
jgi:hypothetical protein